jgi:hypothetical protein
LSEKLIEEDLSQVDECMTRSTYKNGLGYERCEDKGETSTKFVPRSMYKDEEETLKAKQIPYPPNPKPSFNPKRDAWLLTFMSRCVDYAHIMKRQVNYARNSYHDEIIDFPPHISSHTSSRYSHGHNHHSYGFLSRESILVPRSFGVDPHSHRGVRPPRRHDFLTRGVYSHLESSRFDSPRSPWFTSHSLKL